MIACIQQTAVVCLHQASAFASGTEFLCSCMRSEETAASSRGGPQRSDLSDLMIIWHLRRAENFVHYVTNEWTSLKVLIRKHFKLGM